MFKKIDTKYRPIPFWSWNEKLDVSETKKQIDMMCKAGIGGFFMHARGGLETEYMSEEWFENIAVGIKEAKACGMHAWVYDENGWPSGFGNGAVNGRGLRFQQKFLRCEKLENGTEMHKNTICCSGGFHFYYDVNPYYIDTLNREAVKTFIDTIYQPYYDRFKGEIEGIFTDEPQISRNGFPWSFILPEEYEKAYGESLPEHLAELFMPIGDFKNTRFKFWKLITNLFSQNFLKQIYDWCNVRGLKLTGHLLLEETLETQLTTNGAVMPHYEYFHMPGIDWLGRGVTDYLTPLQLSSVAHQLEKKQVLSESFAMCGHNLGFDEMKAIFEWQMANGVTQLCQHLEGYSLRGIRKRDYPPAMYYQQPWWSEYKLFNDTVSRIGMILSEGSVQYDTLLIHPQASAWLCYDAQKNEGLAELNQAFLQDIRLLSQKHVLFHLGDETIMERHAKVEGCELVIGTQRYKTVVLPKHTILFEHTEKLLEQFCRNGGILLNNAADVPENSIVSSEKITYTKRVFSGFDVHYFLNASNETVPAEVSIGSAMLDLQTGEALPFDGQHIFSPGESIIVIDDGSRRQKKASQPPLKSLDLSGKWNIKEMSENALTLDKCRYYFDGELIEENGYVLNVLQRAFCLKRPVHIRCEYETELSYIPEDLSFVCETPEKFDIKINGTSVKKNICGYFRDRSFKKISVAKYMHLGKNIIALSMNCRPTEEFYRDLEKAAAFEGEKNKLKYSDEIEACYLTGSFSVVSSEAFVPLGKNVLRCSGSFQIAPPIQKASLGNLEQHGFPFFAGSITFEKDFVLDDTGYKISFEKSGINAVKIKVNGSSADTVLWAPYECDISPLLKKGKNKIEITLINNLRNLLGPHHLEEGEPERVLPSSFYKEKCIWTEGEIYWNDGYCFVETGIKM